MARKYTRKQVNSLKGLDLEQERIKLKMRRLEDDMLSTFNPQQMAISVIGGLLKRRSKKAAAEPAFLAGKDKGLNRIKTKKAKKDIAGWLSRPVVKQTAKKVGISFLRWQAFNLAWFLGKKLYKKIKHKENHIAPLAHR